MSTLTPTVHERLARCGTRVYIDGLISGADVDLDIDGDIISFVATGSSKNLTVPSLTGGDPVRARQDAGSGATPWSPVVIVEEAEEPPDSAPILPAQVGSCSQCVMVKGCVPGSEIELTEGGEVVGTGIADRNGNKCVPVKLSGKDEVLRGKMIVCGQPGPEAQSPIVSEPALPKPVVGAPLYGCQRIVPLSNLHRGARVRLESDVTGSLGSICSCWTAVNVRVGAELEVGHQIRAQSYWDGEDRCQDESLWSDWEDVVTPDDGITPDLLEALIENDRHIRVANQIIGAEITVYIAATDDAADIASPEIFGPRPASDEQEIALNAPLEQGNVVWVDQSLCTVTKTSDPVLVQGLPDEIFAPEVVAPIYQCGGKVTVTGLHAGAVFRVYQDGFVVGIGWSGLSNTVTIDVAPTLTAGSSVTAKQWVGGQESPLSAAVVVQSGTSLHVPRILSPVTMNDRAVWVSGVTPGSKVAIYQGGMLIGEAETAESLVMVATNEITGPVTAKASLCGGRQVTSETVDPITSPCLRGDLETGSRYENYGSFTYSSWGDGGGYGDEIEGQLYYPSVPGGCLSPGDRTEINPDLRNMPLVIIAHGYWSSGDNYLGYGYLAHHLASWGMIVFSIDLDTINVNTNFDDPQLSARGELILKAVEAVLADPDVAPHLDRENIGLIGHSMGGEGVVVAQSINIASGNPHPIKGVVSIAPTQYREDVSLTGAKYLQLFGSEDYLLSSFVLFDDNEARFNGFRIFDRAERNKSHAWIYGASHDQFNSEWTDPSDDDNYPVSIAEHRNTAKCLMNAFFQNTLKGQDVYEGYLEGLILPYVIRHVPIYMQHLKTARDVLDNFGDADGQVGLGSEALDKLLNRQGGDALADGGDITIWEDVESLVHGNCVHNTKTVDLAWDRPTSWYSSKGALNMSDPAKSLSFRICQYYEDGTLNEPDRDIDLFVEVSDGIETAKVRMGVIGTAQFPDESRNAFSVFRSIRLPADAFSAVNTTVNMAAITSVVFRLTGRGAGRILIDDIEFDN